VENWESFVSIVKRHFAYLETDFGFKLASQDIPFIVYESQLLIITIFLDQFSGRHELDLNIDTIDRSQKISQSLSIDTLLSLLETSFVRKNVYPSYKIETLELAVKEMAQLLKKYGSDILVGDTAELKRLKVLAMKRFRDMYPKH
jgi:hypothetical protein